MQKDCKAPIPTMAPHVDKAAEPARKQANNVDCELYPGKAKIMTGAAA